MTKAIAFYVNDHLWIWIILLGASKSFRASKLKFNFLFINARKCGECKTLPASKTLIEIVFAKKKI